MPVGVVLLYVCACIGVHAYVHMCCYQRHVFILEMCTELEGLSQNNTAGSVIFPLIIGHLSPVCSRMLSPMVIRNTLGRPIHKGHMCCYQRHVFILEMCTELEGLSQNNTAGSVVFPLIIGHLSPVCSRMLSPMVIRNTLGRPIHKGPNTWS